MSFSRIDVKADEGWFGGGVWEKAGCMKCWENSAKVK